MRMLILSAVTFLTLTATAAVQTETKLASFANPTDANIRKALGSLSKALEAQSDEQKTQELAKARLLLNSRKVLTTYPGAIYVDGIKQFEDGEDSAADFSSTCFAGTATDAAALINKALELGFWEGDEESVTSAHATSNENVTLRIYDDPNESDFELEIHTCK